MPSQAEPQQTREGAQPGGGYALTPQRAAEAIAYARARHELYFADFAWGIALLLLFVCWRVGPTLRNWAERAGPNRFVQALNFAPAFQLALGILTLPSNVTEHWHKHAATDNRSNLGTRGFGIGPRAKRWFSAWEHC